MAGELERPPTRAELNRLLIVNALGKELNWITFAVLAGASILIGLPLVLGAAIALVAYLALATVTYLDEDEARKVGDRLRGRRRQGLDAGTGRIDPGTLAPPIAARLQAALEQEERIRAAIDEAGLPFAEVSEEVDRFVRAAERTASRANLLYEYLADENRDQIERRLAELRGGGDPDPGKRALVEALTTQLAAMAKMEKKLDAFYTEMERIAVELGNVRGQLLAVSATTEAETQRELAAGVRGLREQVTAVAEGMSEAIDETEKARPATGR